MKLNSFLKTHAVAIAAIIFAGGVMSFKISKNNNVAQDYFYNSNDMSAGAFHTVSNWTTSPGAGADCVTSGPRPCKITVATGSTLSDVLGAKTNPEVLSISSGRKLAP